MLITLIIFSMVKPRIVLLIFVSGKVVLTGAKVRQEIYDVSYKLINFTLK